jgi:RNA polymerase sigma-70 factor (sigma-E family)
MKKTDETEFQDFVVARWGRLVRTAYLLTGDRHHAEDLAQTALTRAYQGWHRVQGSENPDAYVHRILVRCNASRFRKRRVAESLTDPPESARAAAGDHAEQIVQRRALLAALQDLTARQRAVVVLRYWADLSERETADIVGCSTGTVKSQCHRALAKLRHHPALADAVPHEGHGEPASRVGRGDHLMMEVRNG